MGQNIGNAFGKKDPNATNDMLGSKVVATGTQGAQTVADPSQGLDPSQQRNRKIAMLGLGGLSAAGRGAQPQQASPQPPINFATPTPDLSAYFAPKRNPFFGQ